MKHIILSAILTVVAKWLLPVWVAAALVTLGIGVAKEVYDKVSGKGCSEWGDLLADVLGVIIGVM